VTIEDGSLIEISSAVWVLILRSAPSRQRTCAVRSRVSKDGGESMRCVHPSRRLLRKLLRMRSVFPGRLWRACSPGSALALSGRGSRRMRHCAPH